MIIKDGRLTPCDKVVGYCSQYACATYTMVNRRSVYVPPILGNSTMQMYIVVESQIIEPCSS